MVISLGLIFVFNAGIFLTPSQAACKAAPPAVTDGLGLKMQGPTAPEENIFCASWFGIAVVFFIPTPQPPITKLWERNPALSADLNNLCKMDVS